MKTFSLVKMSGLRELFFFASTGAFIISVWMTEHCRWFSVIPAVLDLQPLNKVNMATIYIIDTHNIMILVNLGICFKHFGGDKTNDKCRQVSLLDGNSNDYGITSHLQLQYSKKFSGAWGKVQGRKKAFWPSFSMCAMMERYVEKYLCSEWSRKRNARLQKTLHSSKNGAIRV